MADTPVSLASANATDSEASLQKLMTLRTQTPPPVKKSGSKVLLAILLFVVLAVAAMIGGGIYLAYRVKQKATAGLNKLEGTAESETNGSSRKVNSDNLKPNKSADDKSSDNNSNKNADKDNPLSSILGKIQGGDQTTDTGNMVTSVLENLGVKNPGMPKDLVRTIPYSALTTPLPCPSGGGNLDPAKLATATIHFKPGTILTSSWSLPKGDAEGDETIESVSPATLNFEMEGMIASKIDMSDAKYTTLKNIVCAKDILTGEAFSTGWGFNKDKTAPTLYPGLSRLVIPEQEFAELKSTGSLPLVFGWYTYMETLTEWDLLAWKGTLKRVEPDDVPFPLIIDDDRVNVPTIHVAGQMKVLENAGEFGPHDQPVDAYILDDPNAPMVLYWLFGENLKKIDAFQVRYIRVRYGEPKLEQKLAKERKAITYGINFDYNSSVITPQSEPVLKEIAQAMADKPDWKLTITGHTDNIGGHAYNVALSQRRSAAVKQALVERYHVNPNRLSTAGDGDSDPVDTNDTLEGRARNRRVELTLD
jgi:outer membrane protein OmpA-like peptidoglycan-associated protein